MFQNPNKYLCYQSFTHLGNNLIPFWCNFFFHLTLDSFWLCVYVYVPGYRLVLLLINADKAPVTNPTFRTEFPNSIYKSFNENMTRKTFIPTLLYSLDIRVLFGQRSVQTCRISDSDVSKWMKPSCGLNISFKMEA